MTYLGEIVGIDIYANDVVVRRKGQAPDVDEVPRGEIVEFSRKSRQRLAFVASNTQVHLVTMISLTYPNDFPCDGGKVKQHLREFLYWLAKDAGGPNYRWWAKVAKSHSEAADILGSLQPDFEGPNYLWWLEFQRRGAPHIHILTDNPLPRRPEWRRAVYFRNSCNWYRIVASGDEKHLQAGCRTERLRKPDGARRYVVKEATKMYQKIVPEEYRSVGRFWGCSKAVMPTAISSMRATEDDVRGVLQGWKYAPGPDRCVYRVLYNTAGRFADQCGVQLDKSSG